MESTTPGSTAPGPGQAAAGPPMARVVETIDVPVSLERGWAALSDFQTFPEWLVHHDAFPEGVPSVDEVGVGTKVKERITFMGMPAEVEWTVASWQPPQEVTLEGMGPMGTTMRIVARAEAAEGGTRITHESVFGGAALAPMLAAIQQEAKRVSAESVANLRRLLAG